MPAVALETAALSLIGELLGLNDLDEFCAGLMRALRDAVPADWSALNELPADLPHTVSLTEPPVPPQFHELFAQLGLQNPIAAHFIETGVGRATRISDLVTRRDFHRLEVYRQIYRPLGLEYQIAFQLPTRADRILGVVLSRKHRDFTPRERDLLNLVRPYIIELYRTALALTMNRPQIGLEDLQALGLTRRQAEVLRLVATGCTAPEAAATLGIAARTAQKHLELSYRKLGVSNRSDACRIAWEASADRASASSL